MAISLSGVTGAITNLIAGTSKSMTSSSFTDVSNMDISQTFIFLIIFMILLTFIMWIGAYIFNHSLVKVFPTVKKVSVGDFLGLYIVIHILFC